MPTPDSAPQAMKQIPIVDLPPFNLGVTVNKDIALHNGEHPIVIQIMTPYGQATYGFESNALLTLIRELKNKIREARTGITIAGNGNGPSGIHIPGAVDLSKVVSDESLEDELNTDD